MKSIQTKFIILILSGILLSGAVIGGAGLLSVRKAAQSDSVRIMNLLCTEHANEIDALLSRIEQSVETLAAYTEDQIVSIEELRNPLNVADITAKLAPSASNAAQHTEGAQAVYVRFNPDFTEPTAGIFSSRTQQGGAFRLLQPTDLSKYDPSDVEHVGWYYIPVSKGKATWILPYQNKNINVLMISYVVPIYIDGVPAGVVGIDIDFQVLMDVVDKVQVYESGYSFLTAEDSAILYHPRIAHGVSPQAVDTALAQLTNAFQQPNSINQLISYQMDEEPRKLAFTSLRNGMRLAITAPSDEINAQTNLLIFQISLSMVLISLVSVLVTVLLTRRIIRPLQELNVAAKMIAEGDMSISITHHSKDEVGMLADSFRLTVAHLQRYIDYINGLAYRDSLTGVKNKTAYLEVTRRLEDQIRLGHPEFAVVVLDINDLKYVNDHYGHDFGDLLIVDSCKIICQTYLHSPVYRIGGDEFVVLLENADYAHYGELQQQLQIEIDLHNGIARAENHVSLARGIAVFNFASDLSFHDVFKRADDAMYQNKAAMKQRMRDAAASKE